MRMDNLKDKNSLSVVINIRQIQDSSTVTRIDKGMEGHPFCERLDDLGVYLIVQDHSLLDEINRADRLIKPVELVSLGLLWQS